MTVHVIVINKPANSFKSLSFFITSSYDMTKQLRNEQLLLETAEEIKKYPNCFVHAVKIIHLK